jgi:hypothetical protein
MALAFGGGVRPELGRTDYTPFLQGSVAGAQMQARGGESIGAALANLGKIAGEAIGQYQERKQEKELFNNFSDRIGKILQENPAFGQQIGITDPSDKGAIKAAVKALGGGDTRKGVQAAEMLVQGAMAQQAQRGQISEAVSRFLGGDETAAANIPSDMLNAITNARRLGFEQQAGPGDDRTTRQKDFEYATRVLGMSPQEASEWAKAGGGTSVSVNMGQDGTPLGAPPSNMEWARGEDGRVAMEPDPATGYMRPIAVPIGGGPIEREAEAERQRSQARRNAQAVAGTTVTQDLGRALEILPNIANRPPLVRLGLAKVPGTPEYEVSQFIESALSNVGLDRLQQMRETSPTGGALGQVPFQQQQRLEQVLGSLKLGQSAKVLEENMKRIQNIYFDIIYGDKDERAAAVAAGGIDKETSDYIDSLYHDLSFDVTGRPRAERGNIQRVTTDAEFDALPSGAEFIGPDGKRRRKP